ncbi:hypothetical protein A3758_13850 [Oleiphilus sp. HI0118]|nr:hypothetical protein A3758_13850 [Oleiphilus sp. HI0118]
MNPRIRLLSMKLKAVQALGFVSVARALLYRVSLLSGLNPVKRIKHPLPEAPFFNATNSSSTSAANLEGNTQWGLYRESDVGKDSTKNNALSYFGWFAVPHDADQPPNWFYDPFNETSFEHTAKPWWLIPDFVEPGADIKSIWELSRFDWLIPLSQRAARGELSALDQLNSWLADWVEQNPPYMGPNWKCGQEASIRVMHLSIAALLLQQHNGALQSLTSLIEMHLKRIRPTLMYALAQDNNHGTSEAAALWLGGSFLALNGGDQLEKDQANGKRYQKLGARFLNERVRALIMDDGSFSQYSVTYHRLMLETMSLCEVWARIFDAPVFSEQSLARIALATHWLASMVIEDTGDAPNMGANDGAHLLPLTDAGYRDFRPTVNLASVLFCSHAPCKNATALEQIKWFGFETKDFAYEVASGEGAHASVPEDAHKKTKALTHFADGGFIKIKQDDLSVFFRYPRFQFRPGQCDSLHVDVWCGGENILRDAGSYSYNAPANMLEYFNGPAGHNTIEFDHRAAMPKLSRFLYGEWLKPEGVRVSDETKTTSCEAGYRDWQGVSHQRTLSFRGRTLTVVDTCAGFTENAVLRWRLINADWQVNDSSIASDAASITISSDQTPLRLELVTGYESRYYLQKTELPVLEVEFGPCDHSVLTITTEISLR